MSVHLTSPEPPPAASSGHRSSSSVSSVSDGGPRLADARAGGTTLAGRAGKPGWPSGSSGLGFLFCVFFYLFYRSICFVVDFISPIL
jgi:hypothetical protein